MNLTRHGGCWPSDVDKGQGMESMIIYGLIWQNQEEQERGVGRSQAWRRYALQVWLQTVPQVDSLIVLGYCTDPPIGIVAPIHTISHGRRAGLRLICMRDLLVDEQLGGPPIEDIAEALTQTGCDVTTPLDGARPLGSDQTVAQLSSAYLGTPDADTRIKHKKESTQPCRQCHAKPAVRGELYCKQCRKDHLAALEERGYLQKVPRPTPHSPHNADN